MSKNVYYGYPSTTIKSASEEKFEKYCEASSKIKYWYKNGESSDEFFSIVYLDKMNKAWTFYPDYIVGDTKGNIWIIETKGGEDAYGYSKNIDIKIENGFRMESVYLIGKKKNTEKKAVYFASLTTRAYVQPQFDEISAFRWFYEDDFPYDCSFENDRLIFDEALKFIKTKFGEADERRL